MQKASVKSKLSILAALSLLLFSSLANARFGGGGMGAGRADFRGGDVGYRGYDNVHVNHNDVNVNRVNVYNAGNFGHGRYYWNGAYYNYYYNGNYYMNCEEIPAHSVNGQWVAAHLHCW